MNKKNHARCPRLPLKFGQGNAKLDAAIFTFSLPAGYTCPSARTCLSRANRKTGTIKDGPHTEVRCYAATMETRPAVRKARWHNLQQLRACKSQKEVVQFILDSLSPFARFCRVHDSGDFYSQAYFDAWMEVARQREETWFYAYTKCLPYWVARLENIPRNFMLVASYGGEHDDLIAAHKLRYSVIVLSVQQAEFLGLPIDHDDSYAMNLDGTRGNFALLVHGQQPAGSAAQQAQLELKKQGWEGYGRASASRVSLPMLQGV